MPDPAGTDHDNTLRTADGKAHGSKAHDTVAPGTAADAGTMCNGTGFDDVVVIVRVYNEAPVVAGVLRELLDAGLRIIAVDDGSTDASADEIDAAGAFRVSHPINIGAGAALQTGIEAALRFTQAPYIACFDADGQHRVVDLIGMIRAIRQGHDVVIGSRFLHGDPDMSRLRRVMLKLAARLTRRGGAFPLTDAHNGLRVFTRAVAGDIELNHAGMAYASELEDVLTRARYKVTEFPVQIVYTDYSLAKGQPLLNSVNILTDILAHRVSGRRPR